MREPVGSNAGGFTFDLCKRNAYLEDKGVKAPGVWKTGTTIAGVVYKARCRGPSHCCGNRACSCVGTNSHYYDGTSNTHACRTCSF